VDTRLDRRPGAARATVPDTPGSPGTGAAARGRRNRRRHDRALPYTLLLPAALILALILGYPLVRLALISAQDYGLRALFSGVTTWNGTANYRAIFTDGQFGPVLLRTALTGRLGPRMRGAVTLCLISAWAMPNVAATLVWQWLFQPTYGVVNWLITATRLAGDYSQHDWLAGPDSAFFVVWLLVVWQSVPFVALTLRAGLSQIPRSYYEAAALAGAGPWTSFRLVTVQFLRPILLLVTILSVIWDFNVFNQIWILTQGGPNGGTTTLGIWSFTRAFSSQSFGQGAAIAVVSVALLLILTAYYVRRLVRSGEQL
jgi:N,N'-diacetylchitobiose transport system permease protein